MCVCVKLIMLLVKKGYFYFHHTLIWWSLCIIKSHSHAFDIRNMHTLSPRIIFFFTTLTWWSLYIKGHS